MKINSSFRVEGSFTDVSQISGYKFNVSNKITKKLSKKLLHWAFLQQQDLI